MQGIYDNGNRVFPYFDVWIIQPLDVSDIYFLFEVVISLHALTSYYYDR